MRISVCALLFACMLAFVGLTGVLGYAAANGQSYLIVLAWVPIAGALGALFAIARAWEALS